MGTHGVVVKTSDFPRGRWLTSRGTLTQRRFHAGLADEDEARRVASSLVKDNPGVVEWAEARSFWREDKS